MRARLPVRLLPLNEPAEPAYHWQLTFRALDDDAAGVEAILTSSILPLLADAAATGIGLAACLHCAGERTIMADVPSSEALEAVESSEAFLGALAALEPLLRVPPKRELWRLLTRSSTVA